MSLTACSGHSTDKSDSGKQDIFMHPVKPILKVNGMKWTAWLYSMMLHYFNWLNTCLSFFFSPVFCCLFPIFSISVCSSFHSASDVHSLAGHYITMSFLMSPLAASGHPFLPYLPILLLLLCSFILSMLIKSCTFSNSQSLRSIISFFATSKFFYDEVQVLLKRCNKCIEFKEFFTSPQTDYVSLQSSKNVKLQGKATLVSNSESTIYVLKVLQSFFFFFLLNSNVFCTSEPAGVAVHSWAPQYSIQLHKCMYKLLC